MSGLRRRCDPPLPARLSERLYRRWAARATGSADFRALGEGSIVHPPALILGPEGIEVGADVVILPGAFISLAVEAAGVRYRPSLRIGDGCRLGGDLVIACCGAIEIGRRVLTADRVFIGDTYHEYRDPAAAVLDQGLHDPRPVRIGDGAFLGINSVVLPGVEVGEGAVVAAGAVVVHDVPPRSVVAGNPARLVRRWDGRRWTDG